MGDSIDRQNAIEAIAELVSSMSICTSIEECKGMKNMQGRAIKALENLPSVQSDIIHCEECVHHIDHFFCRIANHHTSERNDCMSVFGVKRREDG